MVKRWKEFVVVRSDVKTMFDLCSDTESAKTIKALREVVILRVPRLSRRCGKLSRRCGKLTFQSI